MQPAEDAGPIMSAIIVDTTKLGIMLFLVFSGCVLVCYTDMFKTRDLLEVTSVMGEVLALMAVG